MRLRSKSALVPAGGGRRSGYTLVEILVATTLTLILMTAVVTVFAGVGDGISKARRAMEQFDRLRTTAQQLRMDLQGVTVTLDGRPARPEENRGYLEIIEGGMLSIPQAILVPSSGTSQAINAVTGTPDLTVGERGDILMFTTRNAQRPFVGRYEPVNLTLQSDVAEVAWFLRGKTLHRRVLLVAPGVNQNSAFTALGSLAQRPNYYANNDISVRLVNNQLVANSLGDLTKRENRFAHPVDVFPFDVRRWGSLGLPTLAECSSPTWMVSSSGTWVNGSTPPVTPGPAITQIDMWDSANIASAFGLTSGTISPDQYLATGGTRQADDVVLGNVIGFDVKVWDPGAPVRSFPDPVSSLPVIVKPGDTRYAEALNNSKQKIVSYGAYVDLGWSNFDPSYSAAAGAPATHFWNYKNPNPKSGLVPTTQCPQAVYDSYSFSYENEGIYYFDNSGNPQSVSVSNYPSGLGQWPAGTSTNGLDDDGDGIVDGPGECITSPPYPFPLRGIQIKIRCYEPDSRQVREITLEQDFLPK
ncbi:MAG: type II secretion system protein [Thermoguttaceae bacterium]|jgi:type II secretory pathway component PulJ